MSWYEKAKKPRKPYKIYRDAHGELSYLNIEVNAYSEQQAVGFVLQNLKLYPRVAENINMGYEIVAILDKEKFEEQNRVRTREEERQNEKEQRIQDIYG